MEADFPGLFSSMGELWRFMGPTGHAAVYLGVMVGFFLVTVRGFVSQFTHELGTSDSETQKHSKWRIPAMEK